MVDVILGLVIGVLMALLVWLDYNNRKERTRLINLLVSKNLQDAVTLNNLDKKEPSGSGPTEDFVPLSEVDDEALIKFATAQ